MPMDSSSIMTAALHNTQFGRGTSNEYADTVPSSGTSNGTDGICGDEFVRREHYGKQIVEHFVYFKVGERRVSMISESKVK